MFTKTQYAKNRKKNLINNMYTMYWLHNYIIGLKSTFWGKIFFTPPANGRSAQKNYKKKLILDFEANNVASSNCTFFRNLAHCVQYYKIFYIWPLQHAFWRKIDILLWLGKKLRKILDYNVVLEKWLSKNFINDMRNWDESCMR